MGDYTLGIKELDNKIESIKKGTNILLIGPPMSGKDIILKRIMYNGASKKETAVITVSTNEPAPLILEWFTENKLELPVSRIGIIDCVPKMHGGNGLENESIKIASSPLDLTGIGIKISQFFEYFLLKKKVLNIQLHINSLSTILMYSNIQIVFRFLHVFTGRIKTYGGLGIYVLEGGMHDEHTITTLKQLFDAVIEIKLENDMNYIRMVGLSTKTIPWFEYEIIGANLKIT